MNLLIDETSSSEISSLSVAVGLIAAGAADEEVTTNDSENSAVVVSSTSRYGLTIVVLNSMRPDERSILQTSFSISNSLNGLVHLSILSTLFSLHTRTFELMNRSCSEVMIDPLRVFRASSICRFA